MDLPSAEIFGICNWNRRVSSLFMICEGADPEIVYFKQLENLQVFSDVYGVLWMVF